MIHITINILYMPNLVNNTYLPYIFLFEKFYYINVIHKYFEHKKMFWTFLFKITQNLYGYTQNGDTKIILNLYILNKIKV